MRGRCRGEFHVCETPQTAEEDVEDAHGVSDADNVRDEAAPGNHENCGAHEVPDEVSGDVCAEVVEEINEQVVEDTEDGNGEAYESRHCEKQVEESHPGEEMVGESRNDEEEFAEEDREEVNAGGEYGAGREKE
ncbi:hypothetical protein MTO96_041263 [Rhipicephalus appendiculatus]